jgi:rhodanese-related sulfurtransferase
LLYEARVDYALKVAALLFAVYLIRRFTRRDAQGPIVGQRWSTGLGRVVGQAAVLVIVAGVFGIGYHALAETGFLRNPTAVAEVARRYYSAEFPEKALDEMIALVKRKQCVVVDARFAGDFHRGALPGAINLAVDSPLPERQNALLGVSHSSPIVVYCQSTDCRFSDEIATFLKYNGYSNVSIFRGGYREWRARIGTPPVDNSSDEAAVSKDDGGAG